MRSRVGIFFVGAITATGTLLVLDASLPGGLIEGSGNLRYAFTLRREGNLRDAREPGILTFIFQSRFARRDD